MRKTRRASKAKKLHDELVEKGKLGSTVGGGGLRVKYTVAVIDNGKVVDRKIFDGSQFTLNDLMLSLGDNDSIVVKYEQEKYGTEWEKYWMHVADNIRNTEKPPFANSGLIRQGDANILYFKFEKANKYNF
jgi:hypothetical protein